MQEFRARSKNAAVLKARRYLGDDVRINSIVVKKTGMWPFRRKEYVVDAESISSRELFAHEVGLIEDILPVSHEKAKEAEIFRMNQDLGAIKTKISAIASDSGVEKLKSYIDSTQFSEETKKLLLLKASPLSGYGNSPKSLVQDAISKIVRISEIQQKDRIIMLVGTTGVGKTTTIAKLATQAHMYQKLSCAIITTDTYRIGAVDQTKLYADILSIPFVAVNSPQELADAIKGFSTMDKIFIDSVGLSPSAPDQIHEVLDFIKVSSPDATLLCLSLTMKQKDMKRVFEACRLFQVSGLIFTKKDEASDLESIIDMIIYTGSGVSYITTGQSVPDHIERASTEKLTTMITGDL